jgi:hypothetical protein
MERAAPLSSTYLGLRLPGRLPRLVAEHELEGVQLRVPLGDPLERPFGELDRRDGAGTQKRRRLGYGERKAVAGARRVTR